MYSVRCWKIQNRDWQCSLHRLRCRNILDNNSSDGCRDLPRVSEQFQLAEYQLSRRCLHV